MNLISYMHLIRLNITVEKPDNEDDKFTTSVPKDCTLKKLKEKVIGNGCFIIQLRYLSS